MAIAYPDEGITVFSATGKPIRTWKPTRLTEESSSRRLVGYYSPHLHPDQKRLVCIKCIKSFQNTSDQSRRVPDSLACYITEISIDVDREQMLVSLPGGRQVSSPAHSPDGESIAFVRDDQVVIYSIQEGRVTREIPAVVASSPSRDPISAQLGGLELLTAYLRWGQDPSKIFVYGRRSLPIPELVEQLPDGMSPPFGVATVQLEESKVSWLNLYNPYITRDHNFGQYAVIRDGRWSHVEGSLPDAEPIKALFGSERNPALAAQFTGDHKSFLYVDYGGGWFWKETLMRYDIADLSLHRVRTLDWGFYRE